MKSIYKLFVKIYPHILLIFSISLLSIDYYFYNFKNQIYTSSVLKIYPENNFGFFFFICLAFVLIDFKYKVFQKFIHLLKNLDKKIIIIIIVKIVLILSLFDIVFF